jgi:casein kinase 1
VARREAWFWILRCDPFYSRISQNPTLIRPSIHPGSIFRASNVHTNQIVAVKIQYANHECPTNRYERGFYPSLQGGEGMPTLWASGIEGIWDFLVIDLLGPSLDNLFRKSGKDCMDLGSVCSIAMQVVRPTRIQSIYHSDVPFLDFV